MEPTEKLLFTADPIGSIIDLTIDKYGEDMKSLSTKLLPFCLIIALLNGCDLFGPDIHGLTTYEMRSEPIGLSLSIGDSIVLESTLEKEPFWSYTTIVKLEPLRNKKAKITCLAAGTATITCKDDMDEFKANRQECTITIFDPHPTTSTTTSTTTTTIQDLQDTELYGTYDAWGFTATSGWVKAENNQLAISANSIIMAANTVFPNPIPTLTDQSLHIKDGQIWMTYKISGMGQTTYLYDYYLEDSTRFGTSVLWLKADTSNSATLSSAPDPATASMSQLLIYIPVGNTPL